jgi:hypothetical protein
VEEREREEAAGREEGEKNRTRTEREEAGGREEAWSRREREKGEGNRAQERDGEGARK